MAKLFSAGGITFFTGKNGSIICRSKPGPNKQMKTHPRYQRTREHQALFAAAATAGKEIRACFRDWTNRIPHPHLAARLSTKLMRVMNAGGCEDRMKPCLHKGDISLLEGFDFNPKVNIHSVYRGPYSLLVTKNNRRIDFSIPSFVPASAIEMSTDSPTHFNLVPQLVAYNPEKGNHNLVGLTHTKPLPLDGTPTEPISIKHRIILPGNLVVLFTLGIRFYQKINDEYYPMAGRQEALTIIRAFKAQ